MKIKMSRTEAGKTIDRFFLQERFSSEEVRKIKRLAMKFNIKLGKYRKLFCKNCLLKLRGKLRINNGHKTIVCENCGCKNMYKIV
jgi:RNase P subunit RPR2